jgi:hypothetical protein
MVLATNIAETSLTIEDVVYVVDSGKLKVCAVCAITRSPESHLTHEEAVIWILEQFLFIFEQVHLLLSASAEQGLGYSLLCMVMCIKTVWVRESLARRGTGHSDKRAGNCVHDPGEHH